MRLLLAAVISVILTFSTNAQTHSHSAHKGRMGSHGMVLFTDGIELYASHLPLYRRPHDYQIVIAIDTPDKAVIIETLHTLKNNGHLLSEQHMLTMLPDNFDLNRLIAGESFSVKGTLFNGHFERGGTEWKKDQPIEFSSVVWVSPIQLKEHQNHPKSNASTWYPVELEQANAVLFLHRIDTRPSFDAIVIAEGCETIAFGEPLTLPNADENAFAPDLKGRCADSSARYIETKDFQ